MRWLLDIGFQWTSEPRNPSRGRRVALLSMPAESPAAGLLALGALVGDMSRPDANDIHGHHEALQRNARQYIQHCRSCRARCHPDKTGCGFLSPASERLRRHEGSGSLSIVGLGADPSGAPFIEAKEKGASVRIFAGATKNLRIDGEPPYLVGTVAGSLAHDAYAAIFPQAKILRPNLGSSHAGVCLAGRPAGPDATRFGLATLTFHAGSRTMPLPALLTIASWMPPGTVSRMTYFNTRTGRMDRPAPPPDLVIADGDTAFLEVLRRPEFGRCDVLGVVHRCSDRMALEEVRDGLAGLRQWYRAGPIDAFVDQPPPAGLTGVVLCREV
jgi:hypothetical protein